MAHISLVYWLSKLSVAFLHFSPALYGDRGVGLLFRSRTQQFFPSRRTCFVIGRRGERLIGTPFCHQDPKGSRRPGRTTHQRPKSPAGLTTEVAGAEAGYHPDSWWMFAPRTISAAPSYRNERKRKPYQNLEVRPSPFPLPSFPFPPPRGMKEKESPIKTWRSVRWMSLRQISWSTF